MDKNWEAVAGATLARDQKLLSLRFAREARQPLRPDSSLLCLQELFAQVFIRLQALLMGKKIFFCYLEVCKDNLRHSAAAKAAFLPGFACHFGL